MSLPVPRTGVYKEMRFLFRLNALEEYPPKIFLRSFSESMRMEALPDGECHK